VTPLQAASASSTGAAAASPAASAKPTIVLVHGAWADSSSWGKVIPLLQQDGYTVLADPNPLRGLASDAAYLTAFMKGRTTGPVVLVGHSYGGAVITDAALHDPTVKALVYVDAFAPAKGQSCLGLIESIQGGPNPASLFQEVKYPGAPAGDADLYLKPPRGQGHQDHGRAPRQRQARAGTSVPHPPPKPHIVTIWTRLAFASRPPENQANPLKGSGK
jgi:pimeloyl-ACP methyl ester carboxylesterase